jgi:UDP-N-acetylglucosamine diphosphorylase / glucose-1-phosphate thymidylyltransferase / UDP-N-acetylgalactosamine diphosphorylase / glucosamine-1-phosphate N-acetyltransferase / galactosamine-1-phosphate N-acetyltransferase
MKVILLAAGRSKRAKPIEDKNFLRFCGKYLIEHQLDSLQKAGFTDIIVMGGAHNLQQLRKITKKFTNQDSGQIIVHEQMKLDDGMAGAILDASKITGDDDIFIVSSNDVVDQKAYDLMFKASQNGADSYLLAYKVEEYFPGGYIKVDTDSSSESHGQITGIIEKPGEGNEPSNMVNLVLHLHKNPSELYQTLRETSSDRDDRYEVALDKLMKERKFQAVPYEGYWQPVKFPWHVLDLMDHFLEKHTDDQPNIDPSAQIAASATIRGNVKIAPGVRVLDNAVIQGPAYIGENTIVANNALVRGSIIGKNCVVGYSTEIARSFIGDDCWFHTNYVGDTVMGNNVSFGAGAICANLRLDEKEIKSGEDHNKVSQTTGRNKLGPIFGDNIRIGVQTSIMPGIRIGSNSMLTSGLTIAQDIAPGKFVKAAAPSQDLEILDNRAQLDPNARDEMKQHLTDD